MIVMKNLVIIVFGLSTFSIGTWVSASRIYLELFAKQE